MLRTSGLAVLSTAAALLVAAPASAVEYRSFAERTATLRADATSPRACNAGATSGRAVDRHAYTAPADGYATATLRGPNGSDWDLALVDRAGRRLNGAANLGAREQVTTYLKEGQRIAVVGCHRSGPADAVRLAVAFTGVTFSKADRVTVSVVRVKLRDAGDLRRLLALGLDTTDHPGPGYVDVLLHGDDDAAKLRAAGLQYAVRIRDVAARDARNRLLTPRTVRRGTRARAAQQTRTPTGRTSYRMLDDYQRELRALAEANPTLVRLFSVGKSFEGRDILGIEIAEDVTRTDDGRPHYVQVGVHHAREWPSGEAPMEFAYDLIQGHQRGDADFSAIVRGARTFVIPVLNVDGFDATIVSENANLTDPENDPGYSSIGVGAYKRKTCTTGDPALDAIPCAVRTNGDDATFRDLGVDANRNYGPYFAGGGTSNNRLSLVYHGERPFSEIEVEGFRRWLRDHQPAVVIGNHTYTGLILRPPGFAAAGLAPDEDRLRDLGDRMALHTDYISQFGFQLYDTTGTLDDYVYLALNGFAYTPEIGKVEFHPAYETGFVPEYDGQPEEDANGDPTGRKLGGLRRAYIEAGREVLDGRSHAVIAGTAPAGRTLRLSRGLAYSTSPGPDDSGFQYPTEVITESRVSTLDVGADGAFDWHVNPSRQPSDPDPGTWKLECLDAGGNVLESRDVYADRGQTTNVALTCGAGSTPTTPAPTGGAACTPPDGFTFVDAQARRRGLRFRFSRKAPNPVTVEVFRVSSGRTIATKRVARFTDRRGGFSWSGRVNGRYVPNGFYYVRFTIRDANGKADVRRVTTEKERGAWKKRGTFFLKDGC